MSKPVVLYAFGPSPNPLKIALTLSELGVPFETKSINIRTGEQKHESFIKLNPNGRLPVLEDPNTGIVLWESGAIIEYLIEKYDPEAKLHYTTSPQQYLQKTWLYFQVSGQGPYFGQLYWFKFLHEEKNLTSVLERYDKEVKRVTSVIDAHLAKQGTAYLVGDKVCYADIAFIPYFGMLPAMIAGWDYEKDYPTFAKWFNTLTQRPAVRKILDDAAWQRPNTSK